MARLEGTNIAFEIRYSAGDHDESYAALRDLVEKRVEVIVVNSAGLASIARQATARIPIVSATAELVPPIATTTLTWRAISSVANVGRRSSLLSAKRDSIDTLWPSMNPS